MNKKINTCFIALIFSSCSYIFDDHRYDYLEEAQINEIRIEDSPSPASIVDYYPVPEKTKGLDSAYRVPLPEQFFSSGTTNEIRLHKLGELRWVYIESLPSSVWPVMKNFWMQTDFGLLNENPDSGIIMSNDIEINGDITFLEMRLEHGIRQASSEIFVTHLIKTSSGVRERVRVEDNLEEKILRSSLDYLSEGSAQGGGTSLVALNLNIGKKATLRKSSDGQSMIQMNLEFARAWAAVDRALKEALIPVTDLDRDKGIFYVNFSKKKEGGFLTKLFKSRNSQSFDQNFTIFIQEIAKEKCTVSIVNNQNNLELSRDLLSEINQSLS